MFWFENSFIVPVIFDPEVFSSKSNVKKLCPPAALLSEVPLEMITPAAAIPPLKVTLKGPKLFCIGIVTIPPLSGKA